MADIQLNSVTVATETGGTVTLDSAVAGIPAAGITGTIGSGVTFPEGHIIKFYSHMDENTGLYTSNTNPLGGSSGLRTPASGTNITTTVANSKFYIHANISSGWGGTHSGSYNVQATDFGLYIYRNNVSGTTSTRVGGSAGNNSSRGGANTWYGNDDSILGYNPLDTRVFVVSYLDAPGAAAGTTLYYSIGADGTMSTGFAYNRCGLATGNGVSASTLTIYEIAP